MGAVCSPLVQFCIPLLPSTNTPPSGPPPRPSHPCKSTQSILTEIHQRRNSKHVRAVLFPTGWIISPMRVRAIAKPLVSDQATPNSHTTVNIFACVCVCLQDGNCFVTYIGQMDRSPISPSHALAPAVEGGTPSTTSPQASRPSSTTRATTGWKTPSSLPSRGTRACSRLRT